MYKIIYVTVLLCFFIFSNAVAEEIPDNLLRTGTDYYRDGKLDKAEKDLSEALKLYKTAGDLTGEGLCSFRLGNVYQNLRLYEKSIESYDNALNIFTGLSDKGHIAETLISRGEAFCLRGNYQETMQSYEKALNIYKELSDNRGKAVSFEHIGNLYYELGLYEEAIKYLRFALEEFNKAGDLHNKAILLCRTGMIYYMSGNREFGNQKVKESMEVAPGDKNISLDISTMLGEFYLEYNEFDNAFKLARDIEKELIDDLLCKNEDIKKYYKTKKFLFNIAETHLNKGNDREAFENYGKLRERAEAFGDKGGVIDTGYYMAEIYRRQVRADRAIEIYTECLTFYREAGNRWGVINTDQQIAAIYEEKDELELAARYYMDSIQELEKLRGEITSENLKESFSEKVMPVYRKVIDFFLRRGKNLDAFNYLEMSRARALLDSLAMAGVDIKKGAEPALLEGDRNLQAEINYLEKSLQEEKARYNPDSQRVKELNEKLDITRKKLDAVRKELSLNSPSYSCLTGIKKSLTVEEIQKKVLKDNQYILEYFINNEKINVWIISKKSVSLAEIPSSEKDITAKIEAFRKPFTKLKNETGLNNESFKEILSSVDLNNLHDLYNILFKPLVQKVSFPKNSELIIVPDGILYYLPFEVLISDIKPQNKSNLVFSNFSSARFLIEDYIIDYVPSASILDPALDEAHKKNSRAYLGFGNPSFEDTGETTIDETLAAGLIRLQGYSLKPLPGTEIEVKNICEMFRDSGDIYIRKEATEENFKKECSSYKYLLLATHGLLNEKNPMESSLAFSMNSRSSEDGFLKASEVLNLDINAELVVLSACETGLGRIRSGEGVVGLTRSFMYAGTPSIVVSLWSVDSSSTARLMEIFYKKLLSGMNRAEALRQAKLELMKDSDRLYGESVSYRHPFFWAPFVFVGKSEE